MTHPNGRTDNLARPTIDAGPLPSGAVLHRQALTQAQQVELVAALGDIVEAAPFYTPTMPRTGKPLAIQMTNCGALGWVTDKAGGYRYQVTHPVTGDPWPPIPPLLLELWQRVGAYPAPPEACLINLYRAGTKLGSHVDGDEPNREAPVVSVSLGLDAIFHIGGVRRTDPKVRVTLRSGDVFVLGGATRSAYHGIDRILAAGAPIGTPICPAGCRINLTMRRVTAM